MPIIWVLQGFSLLFCATLQLFSWQTKFFGKTRRSNFPEWCPCKESSTLKSSSIKEITFQLKNMALWNEIIVIIILGKWDVETANRLIL